MHLAGGRSSRYLWLAHHGESSWNAAARRQRQIAHSPLSARGTLQAYAAGYSLRGNQIERIVTSDAVRARQTAAAMASVLGAETVVDTRLRERDWTAGGKLSSNSSLSVGHLEDPTERIRAALLDITTLDRPTAVVTHGDIVRTILDLLRDHQSSTRTWTTGTDVPNGSVIRVSLRTLPRLAGPA